MRIQHYIIYMGNLLVANEGCILLQYREDWIIYTDVYEDWPGKEELVSWV